MITDNKAQQSTYSDPKMQKKPKKLFKMVKLSNPKKIPESTIAVYDFFLCNLWWKWQNKGVMDHR